MPDDTQTGGQEPNAGAQPQAGNAAEQNQNQQSAQGTSQVDTQQQQPAAGDDLQKRLERMEKELAETRKEAASYRTKAKELDKRIADDEAAKLSDIEKAQKRAEAAEQAAQASRARIAKAELKVAAKDAGIIDPDDALAHLSGRIEFDDDGEPKNVADLVKDLKASKPHLFAAPAAAASPQGQQQRSANTGAAVNAARSSTQGGAGLTREIIEHMTPREHAARRAEVMAWLAAHPNG